MKSRTPKAGVTGSINREAIDQAAPQAQVHPVGRANLFKYLRFFGFAPEGFVSVG